MQRTIPCTNPNCETEIIVPAGAMQVVCENCSTWHFPAPQAESEGSYAASTDSPGNYDAPPPLSEKVNLPPPTGYGVPEQESPVAARYDAPESLPPVVPPRNSFGAENTAAETNVGCLVTDSGVRLQLREGRNVIGRKNTDLVIEDRTVSRRHCVVEIFVDAEGKKEYFIYDIGHAEGTPSTNGVFLSGRSLRLQDYERVPMRDGMSVRIGNVGLKLQTT